MAAMDRWIFHLTEKHPDADAPCLAYLDARPAAVCTNAAKALARRSSGVQALP